jgi:SOS-response transcriptional repressor LexA
MEPIEEIEEYRERQRLKPADMARLFKVALQNYNNWVYRKSLPKQHYRRAGELLGKSLEPSNVGGQVPIRGWIPLISSVQAGEWNEAVDLYEPGHAEQVSPTIVSHSVHTFALRVDGDSMTLPDGVRGHSFPHGMIIYVDPIRECEPGCFVVARLANTNRVTFKRLETDEGRPILMPLNVDRRSYPIIRDNFEIIGRIIDAGWGGI